jgi:hypothetical protein
MNDAGMMNDAGTSDAGTGTTFLPALIATNLTVSGDVFAATTSTIATGATLTVQAGAVVRVAAGASLVVNGTLLINGTKTSWVELDSQTRTGAGLWAGLVVGATGVATLNHVNFHHAALALTTQAGSSATVTGFRIDTSSAALSIGAASTFRYGTVHSLGVAQAASPLSIAAASPTFTDVVFDNANAGVDMIVISGGGATFDHVEVTQCHCAFHFGAGQNITVRGSTIHDNAYALMNYGALNTRFEGSNLTVNTVNIGICTGGTFVGVGNYAAGSMFDTTCATQMNTTPSATALTGVGPRPEP